MLDCQCSSRVGHAAASLRSSTDPEARPDADAAAAPDHPDLCRLLDAELRRAKHRLRQVDRLALMGQVAGGLAHDFNNVLGVIVAQCEMLARRCGEQEQPRVHQILESAARAGDLTRRLLALGRREALQPGKVQLDALARDFQDMLDRAAGPRVTLKLEAPRGVGPIVADPAQMQQVLLNLVINARDAMPHGGSLSIELANATVGDGDARHRPVPGEYVRLSVTDTGEGMDAETRARSFEPFFTTKPDGKGSGLGLATVHEIVAQCGGHIDVESEVGRGTCVTIHLPRSGEPTDATECTHSPAPSGRGDETVLIVEDEVLGRDMLREVVEMLGYKVRVAARGTEALDILSKAQGTIDVLLTDVVMPGLSGIELAKRACAADPRLRVVYLSGYPAAVVAQRDGGPGPDALFLPKPFTPDALGKILRRALDSPRREER